MNSETMTMTTMTTNDNKNKQTKRKKERTEEIWKDKTHERKYARVFVIQLKYFFFFSNSQDP